MGWRRQWHPIPVLLPGKSHGWRSLVGCSPWSRKELDMTERLHFHFSLSCIGEGNGNPLQCSCLENPRDGGAWWAAVYGVAQSWTRLKRLSSRFTFKNMLRRMTFFFFFRLKLSREKIMLKKGSVKSKRQIYLLENPFSDQAILSLKPSDLSTSHSPANKCQTP